MSTRNLPEDKGRPARKADNLTAIYVLIVKKMWWEPRPLTTLWASTAFYRTRFTFLFYLHIEGMERKEIKGKGNKRKVSKEIIIESAKQRD
jgi:hypothetical protein